MTDPLVLAVAALLHVLVLVYWLGGDLGAFYASTIVSDPRQSAGARVAAARVLAAVDMAPRTALILAAPTGLTLASLKGWWFIPPIGLGGLWVAALLWLGLAWTIHLRHAPPGAASRRADLLIRWLAMGALAAAAFGAFGGVPPLFLHAKLMVLAAAIGCGLAIRMTLAGFGPAFAQIAAGASTPEAEAALKASLDRSRPIVLTLWALLLCAALLGLWTPT